MRSSKGGCPGDRDRTSCARPRIETSGDDAMKRGRKPKPVRLRVLAGNPGKRALPAEPAIDPGIPARPPFLDRRAREEWDYIVAQLGPAAVLRKVDRMPLAGYCLAVSRAIRAERSERGRPSGSSALSSGWVPRRRSASPPTRTRGAVSRSISHKRLRAPAPHGGFEFDEAAAARAVGFFAEVLRHTKGEWAGEHFALAPWQEPIVRNIFGWKRPDGTRRYRRVYIEVPRKNGKSTLVAGLALYLLYADREAGAEVFSVAADREQAGIVFEQAKAMAELEPDLVAVSEIYRRSIVVSATSSTYRVLSADVPTKHGLNAHGVLFDELHAQPTRDLWDVLTTSTGARRQPLVVAITTAGYDRQSVCWEVHEYARQVRAGVIDDSSFLPVIYAAEPGDDWTDEAVWRKANPGLGITVKLEYLRE